MSESPEDRKHEADAEEVVREDDAPANEDKDEDVRDADEEHVNGVDKEKDRDDRSPSPRARSESRDRDVSRSPASRSPVLSRSGCLSVGHRDPRSLAMSTERELPLRTGTPRLQGQE